MALARIITRSQVCARELALHLLARGYAVEIVAPDSVPNNKADLELRLDDSPGDQLVANVEAHNGDRSSSFEFRHQLRASMQDFLHQMQDTTEVVYLSQEPASFIAAPDTERVELPEETSGLAIGTVSAPAPLLLVSDPGEAHSTDPHPADPPATNLEAVPLPSLQEPQPLRRVEAVAVLPSHFAKEAEAVAPPTTPQPVPASIDAPPAPIETRRESPARRRPGRREWSAALTFASIVLLALVLALGVRRSEKTSASGAASTEKVAVPSVDAYPSAASSEDVPQENPATVPGQNSNLPASQSTQQVERDQAPKNSTNHAEDAVVKASIVDKTTVGDASRDNTGRSRQDADDLIAPDTVTYFAGSQPRASKTRPGNSSARRNPAPHKQSGGVVAANTVTYFNKPIPKPPK